MELSPPNLPRYCYGDEISSPRHDPSNRPQGFEVLYISIKILSVTIFKHIYYLFRFVFLLIFSLLFRSPNVFLTGGREGIVAKVADFGMSRRGFLFLIPLSSPFLTPPLSVTTFLSGLGKTWQWLAPEVIDADSVKFDERADNYSFGIVAWEVLTRTFPFAEYQVF